MTYDEKLAEWKAKNRVVSGRKVLKGFAAIPGGGPAGETCGSCSHLCRTGSGRKTYFKCGLMRAIWTFGPGTDVKARSPSCRYWERRPPKAPTAGVPGAVEIPGDRRGS